MRTRRLILTAVLVGTIAGLSGSRAEADGASKIDTLCDGNANLAKLDCKLLFMRKAIQGGASFEQTCGRHVPWAVREGRVQCLIGVTAVTPELLAACAANDLQVVGTTSMGTWNVVVVRCDSISDLEPMAARADVRGIHPESEAATNVTSGGDHAMRADLARTDFQVTGAGVRVGVISDSVRKPKGSGGDGTVTGDILTGTASQAPPSGAPPELPAQIRLLDPEPTRDGNWGGRTEGAAMMELIHDVAPGAALSFASGVESYALFPEKIIRLRTEHACDVIVDDVVWFLEPIYQDGWSAMAVDDVVRRGAAYFSAAGNDGGKAHESYYTDFDLSLNDENVNLDGNDFHDFGAAKGRDSQRFLKVEGAHGRIVLKWNEPYGGTHAPGPGSTADLDLYLVREPVLPLVESNIVASSVDIQGTYNAPFGDAVELISFDEQDVTNPPQGSTYYVCVDHHRGRRGQLKVHLSLNEMSFVPSEEQDELIGDRTIFGHAAAAGAAAVGMMQYPEADGLHNNVAPATQLDVNPDSAVGGEFAINYKGDPVVATYEVRRKPDFVGPDGGATTVAPWQYGFYGTSAAAPHVAAVAALIVQAHGHADTGPEIYARLAATATDMEDDMEDASGFDVLSGAGLVDAKAALDLTPIVKVAAGQSIQSAMNNAAPGAYVVVSPGTYKENINFNGKDLRLVSTDASSGTVRDATRIDGRKLGPTVKFLGSESPTCLIAGFRIQNGKALGATGSGGGIQGWYCLAAVRNNIIQDNVSQGAGAGISGCYGTIRGNTIQMNSAVTNGGGLVGCGGTIQDNVIFRNSANGFGGGLSGCSGLITGNTITENTTDNGGGGLNACNGKIQDNLISDNATKYTGGGLENCDGEILDNEITENACAHSDGGGLYRCDGTIARNLILRNRSRNSTSTYGGNGGGLADCQALIHANVIAFNVTKPNKLGGGLFNCNGEIAFNTIFQNTASAGGGMHSCGATTPNWVCANNIIWANSSQVASCGPFKFCDVQGWTGGGPGNMNADPKLADPSNDDFHLLSTPLSTSPCLGAGLVLNGQGTLYLDFEKDPRLPYSAPDIGADERP